ncbi:MAG: DUF1214 domain-containing protein, partial [Synergistaceae bacterium]|nr:DUF1214 domain-containing protein [Synergistaceae bacterium]
IHNPDGSVDFYLQSDSPGKDLEPNWLPVPEGIFLLTMRIYLPELSVLDFSWKPPYVVKINDGGGSGGCAATGTFALPILLLWAAAAIRGKL